MHCPRCGDYNQDSDRFCITCGQDLATYRRLWPTSSPATALPPGPQRPATAGAPAAPVAPVSSPSPYGPAAHRGDRSPVEPTAQAELAQVPTHKGWAAALLALCWPAFWAAIPALVYAGQTEDRIAAGDTRGAWESSKKAKDWCWVTFIGGLLLWVVLLTLVTTLL